MGNTYKYELFGDMITDFVAREVKPLAKEVDEQERFPVETVEKMAKLGLFGTVVPKEYGGAAGYFPAKNLTATASETKKGFPIRESPFLFLFLRVRQKPGNPHGVLFFVDGDDDEFRAVDEVALSVVRALDVSVNLHAHGCVSHRNNFRVHKENISDIGGGEKLELFNGDGDDFHIAVPHGDHAPKHIDPFHEPSAEKPAHGVDILGHDKVHLLCTGIPHAFRALHQ